jgi:hypothetical protein
MCIKRTQVTQVHVDGIILQLTLLTITKLLGLECLYPLLNAVMTRWILPTMLDAAVNILAHELAETATDPLENAWYYHNATTNKYVENGDQCLYNYGKVCKYTSNSGARYNMEVNGRKYFIQTNWNLKTKSCELQ